MAEQQSSQERTEAPTPRRIQQSRKKGQVPRSRELNTMLSLVIGGVGMLLMGGTIAENFSEIFQAAFSFDREVAFDTAQIPIRLAGLIVASLLTLAPFFALMICGAFVGPLLMGGWSFSVSSLAFKLDKLSPLKGIKRVFSAKGLLEMLKAFFKFLVLAGAAMFLFHLLLNEILALGNQVPVVAIVGAVSVLKWSLLAISLSMVFIVVFDVPFELWNHNRQLKMTLQEVKDELKETDGRPEVKAHIRALQREISQRRMMEAVPTADVVITNPSHFSVALKYEGSAGGAPSVVAKGRGLIARNIRQLAQDNQVPIFSAPPLARALYATAEIGQEIPQSLYLAVAKVLAYVYQLRSARTGEPLAPAPIISVPDEYRDLYQEVGVDGER